MCRIAASRAKRDESEMTRSEKRAPIATKTSQRFAARFEANVPCIPIMPVHSGWREGIAVLPMRLTETGALRSSARDASSAEAPELTTPPPT